MRKISVFSSLSALLLVALTGCLKDKDFDDHKYGLTGTESKSVGFIRAPASPVITGITGQATPLVVNGPVITINGTNQPAASKVTATIVEDASLVTAANLTPLPPGSYTINTVAPSIASGDTMTRELRITLANSDQLDPNLIYGVGYRIQSVDGGYGITRNMREIVVGFAIKNRYDGIYRLQGHHTRPNLDFPYDTEVELITIGPNEVVFYWPEAEDFGHPVGEGPNNALTWYGNTMQPVIVFDRHTDLVTDVYNRSTGSVITMYTGAGSRVSKFDAATRNIVVDWNYNNNPQRAFIDDLTFLRERP